MMMMFHNNKMHSDNVLPTTSVETDYFSELMKRHSSTLVRVQKAVQSQTDKIHHRIENGRYEIREAEQPVVKKATQSSNEELRLKDVLHLLILDD